MSLIKNTASQGIYLSAYDTTASPVAGKASDQANITGAWSKDGGAETAGFTTANPTNIGGGVYWQPLTQAETNGDQLAFRWASSTTGIVIDPLFVSTTTAPVAAPTAAAIATAIFTDLLASSDFSTASSFGKLVKDNLDAVISAIKAKTDVIPASPASTTNITAGTITTTTNLTNLPAIPNNWLTAAGIAASALNGKGDWNTTTPPTSAAIATAVWTDTTAGDFTTATSPGKIIFTQLGGAFTTTSSSVFSTASLANAPTGGSAPTVSQIATAVWQDATAGDFTAASSIGKSLYTLAVSSAGGVTLANSVTHGGAGASLVISQLTAQSTAIFDTEGRVKVSIPGI